MSRVVRALGVGAAVAVIVLSPWAGANRVRHDPVYYVDDDQPLFIPPPSAPALAQPVPAPFVAARPAGGCGCDTVVINAVNELRHVDVSTGDAKAVNRAVTYVSGDYAAKYEHEIKVKVFQVARAISGNAMAGQSIGLSGGGGRCHNFVVKARNVLEDVWVRSGDAKAANHSTILVDPGVNPDRLDIRLHQHARAHAGDANAGQFIGSVSGGGPPGCGSVRVDATNLMDQVDVESGEAKGTNDNTVQVCKEVGCAEELRDLALNADSVQMCTADGCNNATVDDVMASLPPAPAVTPWPDNDTDAPELSTDDADAPEPTGCPLHGRGARECREALAAAQASASPSPSPTPSASPEPSASPSPSPSPTPSD